MAAAAVVAAVVLLCCCCCYWLLLLGYGYHILCTVHTNSRVHVYIYPYVQHQSIPVYMVHRAVPMIPGTTTGTRRYTLVQLTGDRLLLCTYHTYQVRSTCTGTLYAVPLRTCRQSNAPRDINMIQLVGCIHVNSKVSNVMLHTFGNRSWSSLFSQFVSTELVSISSSLEQNEESAQCAK